MAQIIGVTIKGFQSHVDSQVNLGPGLNVITGPSDSGKTAIIRAVRWVAFNEPTGEAFVNAKVGEAAVTIALDSGIEITKQRKSGKTKYWITGYAEPFEKAEVPQEVKAALGISKQTFGDFETALNFAYQLEAPFIISETASAGAKILGKLAGTEVVDLAVKAVGKDTYAARQERQQAEKEIEKINGDLLQYGDLDGLKQALEAAEYMVQVVEETLARNERLENLHTDFHTAKEILYQVGLQLDQLAVVPDLQKDLEQIEKAQLRYDTLLDLYSQYGKTTATVENLTAELDNYNGLEEAANILRSTDASSQRLTALTMLSTVYTTYTQENKKAEEALKQLEGIETLSEIINSVQNKAERAALLRLQASEYDSSLKEKERAEGTLGALQAIDESEALLTQAEANYERIKQLRQLRTLHRLATDDVDQAADKLQQAIFGIGIAEKELAAVWEEAGGICPLCDQPHDMKKH